MNDATEVTITFALAPWAAAALDVLPSLVVFGIIDPSEEDAIVDATLDVGLVEVTECSR